MPRRISWPMVVTALLLSGCQSMYYGTLERLGIEKRELLVSRVEQAQSSQQAAQEEFRSALDQFKAVIDFDGGELEERYDDLSAAYDGAQDQAAEVRDRIDAVDSVGRALFGEWEEELDSYQDARLRLQSEDQLRATRTNFESMLRAMNTAAARMEPVLEVFEDQVLFLKHNLNAKAIASLEQERIHMENRIDELIAEMETAIAEAERFIATMT